MEVRGKSARGGLRSLFYVSFLKCCTLTSAINRSITVFVRLYSGDCLPVVLQKLKAR